MNPEEFYLSCPPFLQQWFINLQGFQIKRNRYNQRFHSYLEICSNADPGKPDIKQLALFLSEAAMTPFWRERFRQYQVDISRHDILTEEIRKLPLLTKKEVKDNLGYIINSRVRRFTLSHTSGTTGSGLIFPETPEMQNRQWAIWWRYRYWHGLSLDRWMGWFGGRSIASTRQKKPPFWRIVHPMKQVMFSSHHLNIQTVQYYLDEIIRRKLTWLHGYPSQISLFAHLIRMKGLISPLPLRTITVGGENLLQHQRQTIEEVFGIKPVQHYGLAEGTANISEHPGGRLLPDLDFALTEFVPVDPGQPDFCRIIGTNYHNLAFPLIRYDSGDLATMDRCEHGKPTVRSIDGRQEDYILLPDGVRLGRLDHIFKDITRVQESQIFQVDPYHIIIRIVKRDDYDIQRDEELILRETRKKLGHDIRITFEYPDVIPRSASGKFRFVLSAMTTEKINPTASI